jgi:nicotinamidase-related amidase
MTHLEQAQLLLIDIQEGFNHPVWGKRNNPGFEMTVDRLLTFWRVRQMPVIHIQHHSEERDSPLRLDRAGVHFMNFAQPLPDETVFTKTVNSAFIGTTLETHLRESRTGLIVVAGLTTDHCVSTSVRMAKNLGFNVIIAEDATATFDRTLPDGTRFEAELVHKVSLASLNHEFAIVRSADEIIDSARREVEWAKLFATTLLLPVDQMS